MHRPLPHSRLLAEIEAWPLASSVAFHSQTTWLKREAAGVLDKTTQKIADSLESYLRLRSGGMSLTSLMAIRDRCWFNGRAPEAQATVKLELSEYITALARKYLAPAGPQVVVRTDQDQDGADVANRVAHWRWLSLRLPADLLVSALYAPGGTPPTDRVSLATSHLERLLQEPIAEGHLHAGAAFGFPVLWTTWMVWLTRSGPEPRKLRLPPAHPFRDGEGMRSALLSAALTRVLLGAFLWRRELELGHHPRDFSSFEENELFSTCERLHWLSGAFEAHRLCTQVLSSLLGTASFPDFSLVQRLYAALVRSRQRQKLQSLDDLLAADPLAAWLNPRPDEACAETLFATRALHYLLQPEGQEDSRFAALFWQYTHIRCISHQWLVQEPGTAGLDWFGRHYQRLSALRGPLENHRYEAAIRHQSADLRLGTIELRTSPEPSWAYNREEVRKLARAEPPPSSSTKSFERGILFHFLKKRELRVRGKPRLNADPSANATGFRFGTWYRERRREALALTAALRHHPELLLLVRGLDVASSELAVPTWAVAPLLRFVRDASEPISARLRRLHPSWRVPPLRMTCHAGEDFSRLVEGLRRVHELCESGVLRNGDRIGHGLALGTEPRQWAESATLVVQPAEERLEDLLWELERYAQADVHAPPSRVERVRSQAVELARRIHGNAVQDLDTLHKSRQLRHQPGVLERLGFPFRLLDSVAASREENLLRSYLTSMEVFLRGQELVEVRTDEGEIAFLIEAQRWLCTHLARLEVTVESNPSSNLLIGDLLGVENHPVLRLAEAWPGTAHEPHPPQDGRRSQSRLMISINSDDPITFATCLADEYAYLYFALLRRHIPSSDALSWIDSRRAHGMRSRFTVAASAEQVNLDIIAGPRRRRRTS